MSREQYEALVERLAASAAKDAAGFARRVRWFLALGYGYLLSVLGVVLGLFLLLLWGMLSGGVRPGSGAVKVLIALGLLGTAILRSLWVRFPPPEGIELGREDAPKLHALVDGLAASMGVPTPHQVLLDGDLNASASQLPRFGFLGGSRNILTVGLPLLHALTPRQLHAVLAHEFGHLAGSHGRFASSIYRVSQSWEQLMERVEGRGIGAFVFGRFARWYSPRLSAHSFVLSRAQEYEADQQAARHAGKEAAASALAAIPVVGAYLHEDFWEGVWKRSETDPEPPSDVYEQMMRALEAGDYRRSAGSWLRSALARKTDCSDTHPALTDRLTSLGVTLTEADAARCLEALAPEGAGSAERASGHFLGDSLPGMARTLSTKWRMLASPAWAEQRGAVRGLRTRLKELDARAAAGTATERELWERATAASHLLGPAEAEPHLRDLLARHPHHAQANLALGGLLLGRGDDEGLRRLEVAMKDPDLVLSACDLAISYLRERGREEEARRYLRQGDHHVERIQAGAAERSQVQKRDRLSPHDLPEEAIERLRAQLAALPEVKEAFLARKDVKHLPEKPCYVLSVVPASRWTAFSGSGAQNLAEKVFSSITFEEDTLIIVAANESAWLAKKLRKLPGTRIHSREG